MIRIQAWQVDFHLGKVNLVLKEILNLYTAQGSRLQ